MNIRKLYPLAVIAAGLLAYQNSFTGPFVLDDIPSIQDNPTIRHLWPIWRPLLPPRWGGITVEGRPLINLSLAVNYALNGYKVWGYHVLNLVIHLLAGLTLFGIVRRTLLQPALRERFGVAADELAFATAVLWTVHPLQTESVTYIIQRAESMMGLFYLLTLYSFIRGTASDRRDFWFRLCVVACALGMASKEVMVSAPLMVLLYDRTFLSDSFREAWRRRSRLYLGLGATWILLAVVLASGQAPATARNAQLLGLKWWQYLATEPGVIVHYLRLSVWPDPLCLDYSGWPIAKTWMDIVPPALAMVIVLGATVWAWKTSSAPLAAGSLWRFWGAWFLLILAPSSSFIPLGNPVYEHRMYLPLAAVVILVVIVVYSVAGQRCLAGFVAAAIVLGFLTWRRNQDFASELRIWEVTVAERPDNPRAYNNLGVALVHAGRIQEAIVCHERALQLLPNYPLTHCDLGIALLRAGRLEEAIGQFEEALRLKPDYVEAENSLGTALFKSGKTLAAIKHYEQALQLKPQFADAHYNLGVALARLGRIPDAIECYERAVRIKPDYVDAHINLGVALAQAGRVQEATAHYEEALRLAPQDAETHYNLGLILWQAGNLQGAIDQWEMAVRLKPDFAVAQYNLGVLLARLGRTQEAIEHYEQALRIKPDYAEAQNGLDRLRVHQ